MPQSYGSNYSDVSDSSFLGLVIEVDENGPTELKVGSSRLASRQQVLVYHYGTSVIYIGPSNVTTTGDTRGVPLYPGEFMHWNLGNIGLYARSHRGFNKILVQELG